MNYYLQVLQNYVKFDGRARRAEFWYFVLFNLIISIALNIVGSLINFPLIAMLYSLGVLLPSIAVGIRRMHDLGKSGWYILIPIYSIILAATPGVQGQNAYGSDPKAGAA